MAYFSLSLKYLNGLWCGMNQEGVIISTDLPSCSSSLSPLLFCPIICRPSVLSILFDNECRDGAREQRSVYLMKPFLLHLLLFLVLAHF
jgi:hypothetical protein